MSLLMRVFFEVGSEFFYLPSLFVVFRRRRHFEFFIGVFQFVCSLLYNFCDATGLPVFVETKEWHELTNILSVTYGGFLLIFLMQNSKESVDHVLRYTFFSLVWICQLKDDYWMENSEFTVWVVSVLVVILGVRIAVLRCPEIVLFC